MTISTQLDNPVISSIARSLPSTVIIGIVEGDWDCTPPKEARERTAQSSARKDPHSMHRKQRSRYKLGRRATFRTEAHGPCHLLRLSWSTGLEAEATLSNHAWIPSFAT